MPTTGGRTWCDTHLHLQFSIVLTLIYQIERGLRNGLQVLPSDAYQFLPEHRLVMTCTASRPRERS